MQPKNLHATALVVAGRGIVITGEAGSGKTTLALALITYAQVRGRAAALVSDDQVLLQRSGDRIVAHAPASIAGLVEVRGRTPQRIRNQDAAAVDLLVRLVAAPLAPRYAEESTEALIGVEIPVLMLEARNALGAVFAVASWLQLPPFDL